MQLKTYYGMNFLPLRMICTFSGFSDYGFGEMGGHRLANAKLSVDNATALATNRQTDMTVIV